MYVLLILATVILCVIRVHLFPLLPMYLSSAALALAVTAVAI